VGYERRRRRRRRGMRGGGGQLRYDLEGGNGSKGIDSPQI